VTPERAEGGSKSPSTPTNLKAVNELRKLTGRATETYTAYGATEILYKECARQADYSIPQAKDKDADMPKTSDGEDLGIGQGWWHTGTCVGAIRQNKAN
jgi:cytochrome b pre-mRNA-processing protein 3